VANQVIEKATGEISESAIQVKIDPKPTIDPKKVEQVRKYLSNRNAPLAEYAEVLVTYAHEYDIDYRLVAAISIIESGGGENCFRS